MFIILDKLTLIAWRNTLNFRENLPGRTCWAHYRQGLSKKKTVATFSQQILKAG